MCRVNEEQSSNNPAFLSYDIVAIQPANDKVLSFCRMIAVPSVYLSEMFQLACSNLEADIITLDLTQRAAFSLKFPQVTCMYVVHICTRLYTYFHVRASISLILRR
jgi:hypothetical protein